MNLNLGQANQAQNPVIPTNDQSQAPAAFDLKSFIAENKLTANTFFFRPVKDKDGKVITFGVDGKGKAIERRPQFDCGLPFIAGDWIYNALADESVPEERKLRMLKYLSDLHNDNVYSTAQKQVTEAVKNNFDIVLTQDVINLPELDFWTLAYKEPTDRKMFSDELIASAIEDFKAIGAAQFKRGNGEAVPAQSIINAAKEIFEDKFKSTKSDKRALTLFQGYIAQWFTSTEQKENFGALAAWLQEKIDLYINKNTESKIGSFE